MSMILSSKAISQSSGIADSVEARRLQLIHQISPQKKSELGQFFTPVQVAHLVASKFAPISGHVRLLDAGAGIGSLTAAFVERILDDPTGVSSCELIAYEVDETLLPLLRGHLDECCRALARGGVPAKHQVYDSDFIATANEHRPNLFAEATPGYTHAILNPPYKKIHSNAEERRALSEAGIETSNLYSAFVWLALLQLADGGELAAITPRSFCNGPYFLPFRRALLSTAALDSIHLFESRTEAFGEDEVLQENIIFHLRKTTAPPDLVTIYKSSGGDDESVMVKELPFSEVVNPKDPQRYIHIITDEFDAALKREMAALPMTLEELGLSVSTGPVVDFRLREWLRSEAGDDTAPLLYAESFQGGKLAWPPPNARKPTAIVVNDATEKWLTPSGWYVVTRRFSSKEEKRRVVASVCPPLPFREIGIENHLNFFHAKWSGMEPELAKGLAAFLNSSLFDQYFRQYSGHTQVNAADLRGTRYPSRDQLMRIGALIPDGLFDQDQLDFVVNEVVQVMDDTTVAFSRAQRINEALEILKQVSAPKAQQNERSALTLLALADIKPVNLWQEAQSPCLGITEMMDWFNINYGKQHAPNTRETVRRQSVHQFVQMGLAMSNPDNDGLPVNSPKNCYQLTPEALALVRSYGSGQWDSAVRRYLAEVANRLTVSARQRKLIPATAPDGTQLMLTEGGQNHLIVKIIEEFCPQFTPGGAILYAGDAGEKFNPLGIAKLEAIGCKLDKRGKMPDVIIHYLEKDWLVIVEATTTHGPVDLKRRNELQDLFAGCGKGLVFVTAFLTRRDMVRYLADIAWETEVWVAESPDHLIHFNGERYLGPYTSA